MSLRYSFQLESAAARSPLPRKLLIAQDTTETPGHVLLILLAYLLFQRERLQMETDLHDDNIPFVPDLVQLDYTLRPALWVECGECSVDKLNRLAVKAPDADLWVVKRSREEAASLHRAMARADLRRNRYRIIGFEWEMFDELLGLLESRNRVFWMRGSLDPARIQFEFNGLWFDHEFGILAF